MRYLFAIFLLCSISSIFAQDTIVTYFDWFGNPTTNIPKASFFRSKANPSKTYYRGDSLKKNEAFKPSQISEKNGRFIFINQSKTVIQDVTYADNKRHGQALTYYDNGMIKDVEFFKNGLHDSISTYYHKTGVISAIEHYEQDSLMSYQLFYDDGTKDTVTTSADIMAEYPGGVVELKKYLADSIVYPQIAIELGIEGKCFLQFQIDETGKIYDVKVMRGVPDCPECDKESVRVVKEMPLWTPAKIHNRYCTSTFYLPISFKFVTISRKKRRNK
ncbi:MAG: TonB family protein [Bacteroidota bacterium]